MNVVKDMALKATRFAKKETKLALLSLALLSLASCTSDPKVLEQEAKLAQSQTAVEFTKTLEQRMFFYNLEKLEDTDDSHVHIYRTRGIYNVS